MTARPAFHVLLFPTADFILGIVAQKKVGTYRIGNVRTEKVRACQQKRTQCYGMQAVFSWLSGLNSILSGIILLIALSQNIARLVCLKFRLQNPFEQQAV